jgi:hypothetical protein
MFAGLHYVHHPAPTVVCDFDQRTMSTCAHGATRALSMGPSTEYISVLTVSIFIKFFVLFNMISIFIIVATIEINYSSHVHIYVVTNLLLFF